MTDTGFQLGAEETLGRNLVQNGGCDAVTDEFLNKPIQTSSEKSPDSTTSRTRNKGANIFEPEMVPLQDEVIEITGSNFKDLDLHEWLAHHLKVTGQGTQPEVGENNTELIVKNQSFTPLEDHEISMPRDNLVNPPVQNGSLTLAFGGTFPRKELMTSNGGGSPIPLNSTQNETQLVLQQVPVYILAPANIGTSDAQRRAIEEFQTVVQGLTGAGISPLCWGTSGNYKESQDGEKTERLPTIPSNDRMENAVQCGDPDSWLLNVDTMLFQSPPYPGFTLNTSLSQDVVDLLSPQRVEVMGEDLQYLFEEDNIPLDLNVRENEFRLESALDSTQLLQELEREVQDFERERGRNELLQFEANKIPSEEKASFNVPLSAVPEELPESYVGGITVVPSDPLGESQDLLSYVEPFSRQNQSLEKLLSPLCKMDAENCENENDFQVDNFGGNESDDLLYVQKRDRSGSTEAMGKTGASVRKKKQKEKRGGNGYLRGKSTTSDPVLVEAAGTLLRALDFECNYTLGQHNPPFHGTDTSFSDEFNLELESLANENNTPHILKVSILAHLSGNFEDDPNVVVGLDLDPSLRTFLRKVEQVKKAFSQLVEKELDKPFKNLSKSFLGKQKNYFSSLLFLPENFPELEYLKFNLKSTEVKSAFRETISALIDHQKSKLTLGILKDRSPLALASSRSYQKFKDVEKGSPNENQNRGQLEEIPLFSRGKNGGSRKELGLSGARGELPQSAAFHMRAWLIDHWDHPYPSRQAKIKLAEECDINVKQVEDWMVNARARVWKPMTLEIVKEMKQKGK